MKRSFIVLVLCCAFVAADAQQDPQFTQWMFDKLSFNPAAAGLNDMHCISMFYRDQWDGFDKDPKTALLNYEGYHDGVKGGLGLTLYQDVLGQETNFIFRGSYAYHLGLSNGDKFTAGIGLGLYNKSLGNKWIAIDDYLVDPVIPNNEVSAQTFDMSLGVMYKRADDFYTGLSMTHLTGADFKDLNISMARHFYFMGGYNFDLTGDLRLRTNFLAKSDFNAAAFDVNANVLYDDMLWAGLSFRPGDAVAPMVGGQYSWEGENGRDRIPQKIMVGYSYDVTLSEIKNYSDGSHELFVTYCFNIISNPLLNRHANPRFL